MPPSGAPAAFRLFSRWSYKGRYTATRGTVISTAASVPRHSDISPSCLAMFSSPCTMDLPPGAAAHAHDCRERRSLGEHAPARTASRRDCGWPECQMRHPRSLHGVLTAAAASTGSVRGIAGGAGRRRHLYWGCLAACCGGMRSTGRLLVNMAQLLFICSAYGPITTPLPAPRAPSTLWAAWACMRVCAPTTHFTCPLQRHDGDAIIVMLDQLQRDDIKAPHAAASTPPRRTRDITRRSV